MCDFFTRRAVYVMYFCQGPYYVFLWNPGGTWWWAIPSKALLRCIAMARYIFFKFQPVSLFFYYSTAGLFITLVAFMSNSVSSPSSSSRLIRLNVLGIND